MSKTGLSMGGGGYLVLWFSLVDGQRPVKFVYRRSFKLLPMRKLHFFPPNVFPMWWAWLQLAMQGRGGGVGGGMLSNGKSSSRKYRPLLHLLGCASALSSEGGV